MHTNGKQARPNIVLVLIDTLRADRLSCYGHARRTSPCIDSIADEGALYERAISAAAWTPPSHASIFTGAYPSRHGVDLSHLILDSGLDPLPEILRRHGYRTFGVSSNYWLSRETRFDRGFDHFVHSWQLVQTAGTNHPLKRQQRKQTVGLAADGSPETRSLARRFGESANWAYERATKELRQRLAAYDDGAWRVNLQVKRWAAGWKRAAEPFFAFVHYMEPHIRYAAPGRYRTMHVPGDVSQERVDRVNQDPWRYLTGRTEMSTEDFAVLGGLYDGEVSYVDQRVGQLYTLLEEQGLLRDTVFIVTSDHGENLGDHGLMSHAYCLYDTLLHVPLIIRYPAAFAPARRIARQVQNLDLFPTILELARLDDPRAWSQVQGESLLAGESAAVRSRPIVSEYPEPEPSLSLLTSRYPGFDGTRYDRALRSIRTGDYKYIWASDGRDELYDLAADPHEARNVIAEHPERAAEMRGDLERWLGSFKHAAPAEQSLEIDDEMRKRLEDLGYLA
jgi:arylsulfatase A-like enzyme